MVRKNTTRSIHKNGPRKAKNSSSNGEEVEDATHSVRIFTAKKSRIHSLSAAIMSSQEGNCPNISQDECEVICEDILLESDEATVEALLCDYLILSEQQAKKILQVAFGKNGGPENVHSGDEASEGERNADEDAADAAEDDDTGDEEEEDDFSIDSNDSTDYMKGGECEMCEREMRLTLHHLIPKCTWKRIKPRFHEAADFYREGNMEQVLKILDIGQELPPGISSKTFRTGVSIKLFLASYTAKLCAPCHGCVHSHHDNMELAERYNTVEKLLEDDRIYKFCQWQSKQKPGKYSLRKK